MADGVLLSKLDVAAVLAKAGDGEAIVKVLKEARLRGRGGAGFSTGLKWELTSKVKKDPKYVVCNADEGEPGTFKDREVLLNVPESLFGGMALAARVVGAKKGFVYLRGEYAFMLPGLLKALEASKPFLGGLDVELRLGSGAYVCGEETSLLESVEGRRGESRNRPPFPVDAGYRGMPTVLNNVETFVAALHIMDKGAAWFSAVGTEQSRGHKLVSVSGDVARPGVYEVALGTPLGDILKLAGASDPKAVQVGGYSGLCVGPDGFGRKLAFEDLPPGGSIIVFDRTRDMGHVLENMMEFFADESCGQCVPCREGTRRLLESVVRMRAGKADQSYLKAVGRLKEAMRLASKCGLGQSAANPHDTIMANFRGELVKGGA